MGRLTEMATSELGPKGGPGFFQVRCRRERHIQAEGTGCAQWYVQGTVSSMGIGMGASLLGPKKGGRV